MMRDTYGDIEERIRQADLQGRYSSVQRGIQRLANLTGESKATIQIRLRQGGIIREMR